MSAAALAEARRLVAAALEMEPASVPPDGGIGTIEAWDSLAHMRIITAVEEALGVRLDPEDVVAIDGVAALAAIVARGGRR